ncbi:MAG: nicotinate (nicotinamide) nucleotide adenylyltransferase [bacterium]
MRPLRSLGLFGGSFNPVHSGHVLLARLARETLGLDEVWFIPCHRSADGKKLAPGPLRLRWLKMALRGESGLKASDVELRRGGLSRTVDTLSELRLRLGPLTRFTLLLGQDQALRLPAWKEAQALPALCRLAVFRRPGVPARALRFKARLVRAPLFEVSSSEIRALARRGKNLSLWLPPVLAKNTALARFYAAPVR